MTTPALSRQELREVIAEELTRLAPELDRAALSDTVRIRDELDLDSFDFVRFVASLDDRLSAGIPETDYAKLETIGGCLDYLAEKVGASAAGS